jgi:4-amino-4-deoxychorismate lyase
MNSSRRILFRSSSEIDLLKFIIIPEKFRSGLIKCRVIYSEEIESVEFSEYQIKKIDSLKIVECGDFIYDHKFLNRNKLDELKRGNTKSDSQEILIIKNGLITDTSYSNVAFYDGTKWFTPSTPLLKGTKRASLIDEGLLHEEEIRLKDLKKFSQLKLINAMIDLDESPAINIQSVI